MIRVVCENSSVVGVLPYAGSAWLSKLELSPNPNNNGRSSFVPVSDHDGDGEKAADDDDGGDEKGC